MVTTPVTNKKQRSHTIIIRFLPGEGFYVAVKSDGETVEQPAAFSSIERAARWAARNMQKLGYTVEIAE